MPYQHDTVRPAKKQNPFCNTFNLTCLELRPSKERYTRLPRDGEGDICLVSLGALRRQPGQMAGVRPFSTLTLCSTIQMFGSPAVDRTECAAVAFIGDYDPY
jgi:hypothetical protein